MPIDVKSSWFFACICNFACPIMNGLNYYSKLLIGSTMGKLLVESTMGNGRKPIISAEAGQNLTSVGRLKVRLGLLQQETNVCNTSISKLRKNTASRERSSGVGSPLLFSHFRSPSFLFSSQIFISRLLFSCFLSTPIVVKWLRLFLLGPETSHSSHYFWTQEPNLGFWEREWWGDRERVKINLGCRIHV